MITRPCDLYPSAPHFYIVKLGFTVVYIFFLYTASKVKHHLNIFLEKTVKLSKYEFILVTRSERDKVVTIYSNFLFDYH